MLNLVVLSIIFIFFLIVCFVLATVLIVKKYIQVQSLNILSYIPKIHNACFYFCSYFRFVFTALQIWDLLLYILIVNESINLFMQNSKIAQTLAYIHVLLLISTK